jgi:Fe-S-cluster containining protein
VPVTHVDVVRLAAELGHTDGWLEWLAPDTLHLDGETDSLVELREGLRLLVLAQVRDSKDRAACAFLRENEGCGIYPQRPACCRDYPFELDEPVAHPTAASANVPSPGAKRVHLKLHHDVLCDTETGIGSFRAASDEEALQEAADDAATSDARAVYDASQSELTSYVARVSEWNRRQRRRRLAGRLPETGEEFVRSLLR